MTFQPLWDQMEKKERIHQPLSHSPPLRTKIKITTGYQGAVSVLALRYHKNV